MVVTRSRQPRKEADVWRLGDANASWYLFETNYDHWGPAGGGDDRRTPGHAHLDKAGAAGFDTGAMWGALGDKRRAEGYVAAAGECLGMAMEEAKEESVVLGQVVEDGDEDEVSAPFVAGERTNNRPRTGVAGDL